MWQIPLADVDFGIDEEEAVTNVIRSGWLTMGEVTRTFENEFAQYNNIGHAVAVSSGTAALHLACIALGLGPGDEVIVPALTFVATANAVRYVGATPIFADISGPHDLNISPESIQAKITDRTKAIIVMHYGGYACEMQKINEIAKHHSLYVIEDAAHAIGSTLENRALGTWGDIGCFSFFSNKNLVTGEGGMVVTADADIAKRVASLRSHGMTSLTWDRHQGHAWSYDVEDLGYNYRLDEIQSAIGRVQLSKLDSNNQKRFEHTQRYWTNLSEHLPDIGLPFSRHPGHSACHIMPVILPENINREPVMEYLKEKRIQTSIHYPPVHTFSSFRDAYIDYGTGKLINTEQVALKELTLPLYPGLDPEKIDYVVFSLREAFEALS